MSGDDRHHLIVPDDRDQAMEIEHPACCPQRGHLESVRTPEGYYVCPFEEEVRGVGLEASFRHVAHDVPLWLDAPCVVRPGRYPIEFGLRLAYQPEAAA